MLPICQFFTSQTITVSIDTDPDPITEINLFAIDEVAIVLLSKIGHLFTMRQVSKPIKFFVNLELIIRARQGNACAENYLGLCHQFAIDSVVINLKEAVRYYDLSAKQENAAAQKNLGYCFLKEIGLLQDYEEATKYFKMSADKGNSQSQYLLGVCKFNEDDFDEAAKHFKESADQENAWGQVCLSYCLLKGKGLPKNIKLASYYAELAASQENIFGIYMQGRCLEGDSYNEEAHKHYKLSADLGDPYGQFKWGCRMVKLGSKKISKEALESFQYMKLSAAQDYPRAQHMLSHYYEKGIGTKKNLALAKEFYERASQQVELEVIEFSDESKFDCFEDCCGCDLVGCNLF